MASERVKVPPGVATAAVVLGLMAFVGLIVAVASALALFVVKTALIPKIPAVRMAAAGLDALLIALVIVSIFTIVGLFRVKVWARYAITLLGLLDFIVFALMTVGVLFGRMKSGMAGMTLPNNPHVTLGDVMLYLAIFYAVLALIGVWWMIYFNVDPVRKVFANAEAQRAALRGFPDPTQALE